MKPTAGSNFLFKEREGVREAGTGPPPGYEATLREMPRDAVLAAIAAADNALGELTRQIDAAKQESA